MLRQALLLFSLVVLNMAEADLIAQKFREAEIVPDVVVHPPRSELKVLFEGADGQCARDEIRGGEEEEDESLCPPRPLSSDQVTFFGNLQVEPGAEYTQTDTARLPFQFDLQGARESSFYTILMVDPDAPSRDDPRFRSWLHLMIVNVPAVRGTLKHLDGDTIVPYNGPTPPKGIHRYVFLVYDQKGQQKSPTAPGSRGGFNVERFAQNQKLGDPVAGTFFYTRAR
ncbi:unnamed protein product [Cyprideis torosa]|uniref:Uncharacterized protein n=1 Tax=Cyprideis torosa TaxID=163714 RepID=A0A7R8WD35_9CRUS|nr:unnamed protein product [Cyprideis torosa]CAG0892725.1 unnamed protein product [Cyprideis torosa]